MFLAIHNEKRSLPGSLEKKTNNIEILAVSRPTLVATEHHLLNANVENCCVGDGRRYYGSIHQDNGSLLQKKIAAKKLVHITGSASSTDAKLVAKELELLPMQALTILLHKGTRIMVCRNSITEYRVDLKNKTPRGWLPELTWDKVPGVYNRHSNEVVIATIDNGTRVPEMGEGHGSHNLVLHEVAHAIDQNIAHQLDSSCQLFNIARDADIERLNDYESQPGSAGKEETFAESAARFFGKCSKDAVLFPNLHEYWSKDPFSLLSNSILS